MDPLGKRLLRALCVEQTFEPLTRHGIDESHMFDEAKVGFRWVSDYVMKHSSWPTGKMVEENIGSTLPEDLEPLSYVCELIRKRSLTLSLESDVRSAIKRIEDRDPDAALAILSDATLRLKAESRKEETVSYRKSGPERFKSYMDSKSIPPRRKRFCFIGN